MEDNIIFKDCKTGTDFENKTVELLRLVGFTADKTGRNDGGIDIVATMNIHSKEYKYCIQCKYFNTTLKQASNSRGLCRDPLLRRKFW